MQLQLILHTGDTTIFHFTNENSANAAAKDRDAAKDLLQQLLPKFKKKANKELEEKNRYQQGKKLKYKMNTHNCGDLQQVSAAIDSERNTKDFGPMIIIPKKM